MTGGMGIGGQKRESKVPDRHNTKLEGGKKKGRIKNDPDSRLLKRVSSKNHSVNWGSGRETRNQAFGGEKERTIRSSV